MDTGGDPPATPPPPPAEPRLRLEPRMPSARRGGDVPLLDDGDQRGERAVYPGDHRGEGIETITIVRRRARFPARAGDPSESLGARGDEPRRRLARRSREPATATRAPMDRRAVDVASASPDSTAEAESATCRPSTRASAMRHSRRARETSSGSPRRSAAGSRAMALDPGRGGYGESRAPAARAQAGHRGRGQRGWGAIRRRWRRRRFRSRASFQEMYRAGRQIRE